MDLVIRGAVVYVVLFVLLRISGNRQFSELTAFDAVLIIIISEATQNALIGSNDYSLTAAFIIIFTLIGLDIAFSLVKRTSRKADMVMDGVPVLLVDKGELLATNIKRERVDENDILAAARELQGLERMDQIKYAVLERDGMISVIPN